MTVTIGVGVEGISDKDFWDDLLHRCFSSVRFDVWNMKTRGKLIARSHDRLGTFEDAKYAAGILILDRDSGPCADAQVVRSEFPEKVKAELEKSLQERYLYLCIAVRKLESWFLADREAVTAILPEVNCDVPQDTSLWGIGKLQELWRQQWGRNSAYNKRDFARQIALRFSVERAVQHSRSLSVAWERIQVAVARRTK